MAVFDQTAPSCLESRAAAIIARIGERVVGKSAQALRLLCAVLAGGHVLLEDVPGMGKTLLAKSLAEALGLRFARVQATADLLPADVVGVHIYDPGRHAFDFRPGPVFAQLLLVDEINRASPRAQSALLEGMEEGQVTVEGHGYPLPDPFTVLATQNPREHEGTFPLPLSQLDRFLFRIRLDYPTPDEETELLGRMAQSVRLPPLGAVTDPAGILAMRQEAFLVHAAPRVAAYTLALVRATRAHPAILLGASPRAGISLLRAARVWAFLHGRDHVLPDDVRALAPDTLAHRLLCRDGDPLRLLAEVVDALPVAGGL